LGWGEVKGDEVIRVPGRWRRLRCVEPGRERGRRPEARDRTCEEEARRRSDTGQDPRPVCAEPDPRRMTLALTTTGWWIVGYAVGGVVVLIAATLLIAINLLARRIVRQTAEIALAL